MLLKLKSTSSKFGHPPSQVSPHPVVDMCSSTDWGPGWQDHLPDHTPFPPVLPRSALLTCSSLLLPHTLQGLRGRDLPLHWAPRQAWTRPVTAGSSEQRPASHVFQLPLLPAPHIQAPEKGESLQGHRGQDPPSAPGIQALNEEPLSLGHGGSLGQRPAFLALLG